jgi:quercetin dioxygenase-like cupin family protein
VRKVGVEVQINRCGAVGSQFLRGGPVQDLVDVHVACPHSTDRRFIYTRTAAYHSYRRVEHVPTNLLEDAMQVTRSSSTQTAAGPGEWFTGTVYIDAVAAPSGPSRLAAASVHFAPGARTAWHTHPLGQTIYVTEGVGLCQRRGGPVEAIHSGDRVFFEPGEDHWHGAAPNRFMTHIAMHEADDEGSPVTWGEHVTDEEYGAAPPIDG